MTVYHFQQEFDYVYIACHSTTNNSRCSFYNLYQIPGNICQICFALLYIYNDEKMVPVLPWLESSVEGGTERWSDGDVDWQSH